MTIRDTGMPILGLKPLTVEFVAVPQSVPEQALYYFLESIVARKLRSNDVAQPHRFASHVWRLSRI
jgi:hypothetical protein